MLLGRHLLWGPGASPIAALWPLSGGATLATGSKLNFGRVEEGLGVVCLNSSHTAIGKPGVASAEALCNHSTTRRSQSQARQCGDPLIDVGDGRFLLGRRRVLARLRDPVIHRI